MAFTTYQALYEALQDAIAEAVATGAFTVKQFTVGGRQTTYRSLDEMRQGLAWAKTMAAMESGSIKGRGVARGRR